MRPSLLAIATLAAALAAAGCAAAPRDRPSAPPTPNVVFILADDLGWGELGCTGQQHIRTPHLDRLAEEGMLLTQHYAGSPVCAPSRATLLTGLHTGHAAIRDNDEMAHRGDVWNDPALEGQRPLPAAEVTVAELLRERGYATACIGKWGLGWHGSEGDPNRQGFDHFFGYECQRVAHNHYPTHLWRNGARVPLDNPPFRAHQRLPEDADPADPAAYAPYRGDDYAHDRLTEEALTWLRAHQDRRFFLYLPYTIPHLALQAPDDALAEYAGAFEETPYLGDRGYLPHPTPRAAYAAMITRLDRDVGRIVALLDELGLAGETLVVFTSDNGPSWVGGVDLEFFESAGGLRGRKAQLYEGGIRVPTIVRWPGVVPAGSRSDHLSAFWDWLPTLVEAAGGAPPPGLDGISLLPTLRGRPSDQRAHASLYWEHRQRAQAIRVGDWKAIRPAPSAPVELYDLAADPTESQDLAAERPALAAELAARMDAERTPSEHFPLVRD